MGTFKLDPDRYLLISDTQIPGEHPKSLDFVKSVKKEFRINDSCVYHVGDETDCNWAGLYDRDPDGDFTEKGEIYETIKRMKRWYDAFPEMKLATSNHMLRMYNKAAKYGIPQIVLRSYKDVIEAPKDWVWQDQWIVKCKQPFMVTHGMEYSGANAVRNLPLHKRMSVAYGHLHSFAGIAHLSLDSKSPSIWGFNTGCLIDTQHYFFKYGRKSIFKPNLGLGVVLDSGKLPVWIPLDEF